MVCENVDEKPTCPEYVIKLQDGSYLCGDRAPIVGNGLGSLMWGRRGPPEAVCRCYKEYQERR